MSDSLREPLTEHKEEPDGDSDELIDFSFFKFFSYLRPADKFLLVVGTISALIAGMILPTIAVIMGSVAEAFTGGSGSADPLSEMNIIVAYVITIALFLFVFSYIFFAFWQHLGENITIDLRQRYL